MTVSATRLDAAGNTTDGSTFATASITFANNRLYLLAVVNTKGTTPDTPTVSGGGLSWVQVATQLFNTVAAGLSRITVFRAMVASGASTGALTITFGGATQTGCSYAVDEFDQCETGGADGAAAIVQSATNAQDATTTAQATLGAAPNAANLVYLAAGLDVNSGITAAGGMTELGADVGHGTPTSRLGTFFDNASPPQTPSCTPGASSDTGTVAVEVLNRGGSGTAAGVGTATGVGGRTYLSSGTAAGAATCTGIGGASAGASGSDAGAASTAAQGARVYLAEGSAAGTCTAAAVGGATAGAVATATGLATCIGHGADTYAATVGVSVGRAQTVGNAQRLGSATGTRAIDDLVLIPGKLTPTTFEE